MSVVVTVTPEEVADNTGLWVLVFLGYGYRYLSFANGLLRWAREASYPVYIMHQTIIVAIGYYVIQASWSPWIKYFVILALTMAACFVLYEALVRRFAVLRFAFGMKALRPSGRGRAVTGLVSQPLVRDDVQ